jgi:FlaA1/EpsC-like NDP-sugar epimerase
VKQPTRIKRLFIRHRRHLVAVFEAVLVAIALTAAYWLRFDFVIPTSELSLLPMAILIAIVAKLAIFLALGLEKGWGRFVTTWDLYLLGIGNVMGSVAFVCASAVIVGPRFSRSVYLIDLILCVMFLAMARCAPRIWRETCVRKLSGTRSKGMLIYGAGAAGRTLAHEIRENATLGYRVVGFLDDDSNKRNTTVMALPVFGCGREAAQIVASCNRRRLKIDEIVIAMPSATGNQMREALANCKAANIPCKTVPGVGELLSGKVLLSQLREISLLDLLGRDQVHLDETRVRQSIAARTVMVTGAAGSIGSELCRQIARFAPDRLIAFEQAESELFRIHNELTARFSSLDIVPQIGDIRDEARVNEVIKKYEVDAIFHAAAYKHVPMMESHVLEAVKNNILGTNNLVTAAYDNSVSNFLMISSDKAVNPTNVMGATKRIAELIVSSMPVSARQSYTKCVSVRFGNVLGSNGSVIPLFKGQIAAGGPVTVTHPEMQRYFMTIPEAAQLVLQAFTFGTGSEIFVLDMGQPIKIVDLARNLIRLSGKEPDVDIEVRFTGLRPGEKLFEEINLEDEDMQPTPHQKIRIFKGRRNSRSEIEAWVRELELLVHTRSESGVIAHIQQLVPEYKPVARRASQRSAKAVASNVG